METSSTVRPKRAKEPGRIWPTIALLSLFALAGVVRFQETVQHFGVQTIENIGFQNWATSSSSMNTEQQNVDVVETQTETKVHQAPDVSVNGDNNNNKSKVEDERKGETDKGDDSSNNNNNNNNNKKDDNGGDVDSTTDQSNGQEKDGNKESRKDDNSESTPKQYKFFILSPATSSLIEKIGQPEVSNFYKKSLNEDSAEIWLHRAFESLSYEDGHTLDPSEADVFLLAGYLHLNRARGEMDIKQLEQLYANSIIEPSKPHLFLVPTTNPTTCRTIGVKRIVEGLKGKGVNLWAVGFERNDYWQRIDLNRIFPVPYIVRTDEQPQIGDGDTKPLKRVENSVFYAGDVRYNAKAWAGCDRNLTIWSLQSSMDGADAKTLNYDVTNIDVQIVSRGRNRRIPQAEYNRRMNTNEYCLIMCGDTPSSRSLTSAMIAGCIPLFVGSRLRGLCEPPCAQGWGWRTTGPEYPHLPHTDYIPWNLFPEVNEQGFIDDGAGMLNQLFHVFDSEKKEKLQSVMEQARSAWIYGKGDPVTSNDFGDVHKYAWSTFQRMVFNESSSAPSFVPLAVL